MRKLDDINKLKVKLFREQIVPTFEKLKRENNNIFDIGISKNLIRVKYNHHFYYIDIIEENHDFYWKLTPYKNSYYTTPVSNNSFERVLFAITEARAKKGTKKSNLLPFL